MENIETAGRRTKVRRRSGSRLAIGALASLAVVATGCEWSAGGYGPTRTGFAELENLIDVGALYDLGGEYIAPVGGIGTAAPVIAGDRVFVAGDGDLQVFSTDAPTVCGGGPLTCEPEFTADFPGGLHSTPAVSNNRVFVGGDDGTLYAFSANGTTNCSGTPLVCDPLWTADTGGAIESSPIVANGKVVVGSTDGKVYTFDAAGSVNCSGTPVTCAPLWTATTGGPVRSSPAIAGTRVVIGSDDGNLYTYSLAGTTGCSGSPVSCTPLTTTDLDLPVRATPAIKDGVAYLGVGTEVHAVSADGTTGCTGSTCVPIWSTGVVFPTVGSVALAYDKVYVTIAGGILGVLDESGTVVMTAVNTQELVSSPTVGGGVVFVAGADAVDGARLYAFDANLVEGCSGSAPISCTSVWSDHSDPSATTGSAVTINAGHLYSVLGTSSGATFTLLGLPGGDA